MVAGWPAAKWPDGACGARVPEPLRDGVQVDAGHAGLSVEIDDPEAESRAAELNDAVGKLVIAWAMMLLEPRAAKCRSSSL